MVPDGGFGEGDAFTLTLTFLPHTQPSSPAFVVTW